MGSSPQEPTAKQLWITRQRNSVSTGARTRTVKSYWTRILCKAIRISHSGYCFLIRKRAYFVFKNAHASLRDRQRVNTCQFKRSTVSCWLDVVWVWREWLGLIKKDLLQKGVIRLGWRDYGVSQMKAPGHPWVSNGPEDPVVMSMGFSCRRYHFNAWS